MKNNILEYQTKDKEKAKYFLKFLKQNSYLFSYQHKDNRHYIKIYY